MAEIRALVVDDQVLLRQSLVTVLRLDPEIIGVSEAANGAEAVEACSAGHYDIVLMDIQMPVMDGIAATERISAAHPRTRVVILTGFEQDDYVYRAIQMGASGFLLKDTSPQAILDALKAVHSGQALLSPSSLRSLVSRYTPKVIPKVSADGLTARQVEVLTLIANGMSNQQIEQHLVISHATLKSHISALLTKLAARDRAQLVIAAYKLGLGTD